MQERFAGESMLTKDLDSAALTAFLSGELKRWTALVDEAGVATDPHAGVHKPEDLFAIVEQALLVGKAQEVERIGSAA